MPRELLNVDVPCLKREIVQALVNEAQQNCADAEATRGNIEAVINLVSAGPVSFGESNRRMHCNPGSPRQKLTHIKGRSVKRLFNLVLAAASGACVIAATPFTAPFTVASADDGPPLPDGATPAKPAWKRVLSAEFDGAFVPGPVTMAGVQIMVKDSQTYAATGGWGVWPMHRRQTRRPGAT